MRTMFCWMVVVCPVLFFTQFGSIVVAADRDTPQASSSVLPSDSASQQLFAADSLSGFLGKLFDTGDFSPRWSSGSSSPDVGWLHVVSDVAIFCASLAIPIILLYFLLRRSDIPFPNVIWLFAAFILACGFTHLLEAAIFWWPAYRLSGLLKLVTAIVSWATVFALVKLVPKALELPSIASLAKELKLSRDRLNVAIQAGNIGAWEWDFDNDLLTWDQQCAQLFDIDEALPIKREQLLARVHPDDRERVTRQMQQCVQNGLNYNTAYRVVHRDGALRYVQAHGKIVSFTEDKSNLFVGICIDCTENELQRQALKHSEQNFRATFEQVAIGVAHITLDGRWLRVNAGLCNIVEYSEAELVDMPRDQIIHPDDIAASMKNIDRLLAGDIENYSMEKRYITKSGTPVWVSLNVSLVRDDAGKPEYLISIIENIQDRKQTEAELEKFNLENRKLSLVASKTQHSVVISDAEGRIEWVNDAFTKMTNHSLAEVVGKRPGELLQGKDTDWRTVSELSAAIKNRESITREILNYDGDGSSYWIELHIDPVVDDEGQLTNFIATQVDISERKQNNQRLLQANERFKRLLKSDILGMMTCRFDGAVEDANDELLKIIGFSRDELDGGELNWREWTPPRWAHVDDRAVDQLATNGAAKPFEKEFIRKDGTLVPVLIGVTVLDQEAGRCLCFVIDTTDQKESENQLRDMKEAAEQASRAKSDFLASMSHELRTPLNGVIGMTELLVETELNESQTRFVKACQSSGRTLLRLINDILDFSKIEAGRLELEEQPFDLLELMDDVAEILFQKVQSKNLELLHHLDHANTFQLWGDSHRLRQVFINLLGNSIKFTEKGCISLTATPLEISEDDVTIKFCVKDTGIGIPEDRLDRLFQSFTQVDSSTTRKYGGTGLGLSISQSIVNAMGGVLDVKSIEGLGSQFSFTLTFKKAIDEQQLITISPQDVSQLQVLLIIAAGPHRDVLKQQLNGWGIEPIVGNSVDEIEPCLAGPDGAQRKFDLMILDHELDQELSSFQRIRSIHTNKTAKLILIAGNKTDCDHLESRDIHVLRKPFGQSHLFNAIVEKVFRNNPKFKNNYKSVEPPPQQQQLDVETKPLRILLAEDNETNQLFAREIIKRQGWSCEIVGDGAKAVQAASRSDFDLILMDCQMPVLDGFDATRQIRQHERSSQSGIPVPIIALTANAVKGDRERCLESGMDDYLSKPFTPQQLIAAIQSAINKPMLDQAPASGPVEVSDSAANELTLNSPFDRKKLGEQCMHDLEFIKSLLDSFETSSQERLEEIIAAIETQNAPAAEAAAHALKGAAGIVAAADLQLLAANFEHAGKDGDLATIEQMIESLQDEVNRCLTSLPKLTAELEKEV